MHHGDIPNRPNKIGLLTQIRPKNDPINPDSEIEHEGTNNDSPLEIIQPDEIAGPEMPPRIVQH